MQAGTPQRELSRLQSGMSGVNILPKARTGQLPLALAERPLDRNGAVKGRRPFYGSTGKRTTVRHDGQGTHGSDCTRGGRPGSLGELFVGPITSRVGHFRHASEQVLRQWEGDDYESNRARLQ